MKVNVMPNPCDVPAAELAKDEVVLWSGRSRPFAALASAMPGVLLGTMALGLAIGAAPATSSLGVILSPVVDSALRTVTPLPVPRIQIERLPSPRRQQQDRPTVQGIAFEDLVPQGPQPQASDVDLGVGAFLLVCKTILFFLGVTSLWTAVRTVSWQTRGLHAVTNVRAMTVGRGATESVALKGVNVVRRSGGRLGDRLTLEIAGRRQPFVMVGLADGLGAANAVMSGLPSSGRA